MLCWISKAAPHEVHYDMPMKQTQMMKIINLGIVSMGCQREAGTCNNISEYSQWKTLETYFHCRKQLPHMVVAFFIYKRPTPACWYSHSSCHLLSYTFSKAVSLHSEKVVFFNLDMAEKATSLIVIRDDLIHILTELLKYALNIRDLQSIQIIFKFHKLLKT